MNAGDCLVRGEPGLPATAERRGKAEDVLGLSALYCDLDYKPAGRARRGHREVGGEHRLSAIIGEPPAAIVHTGHGMQPYWPVKGCGTLDEARLVMARWKVLVETVAEDHKAQVDNVFDVSRVLRAPGTVNRKEKSAPVPVTADFNEDAGTLTVEQVHEAFDLYGIPTPTSDDLDRELVLPKADWPEATETCGYVAAMVNGWKTDTPEKGRHPWALSKAVKLACALRKGCITREHARARAGRPDGAVRGAVPSTGSAGRSGSPTRWAGSGAGLSPSPNTRPTRRWTTNSRPIHRARPMNAEPLALPERRARHRRGSAGDIRPLAGDSYDTDAMLACASIAACLHLDGDTPWLLVVSGSGFTKTETVSALAGMGAHITSTITSEGALLSATSRRERTRNATGGLLRTVGEAGVLVIKDVTAILSMGRELRASVLAALREVADGYWERNVGTDGGQTLTWEGRCITVGAVTTAWDKHYQVVAEMGDRFLLVRMDSNDADSRTRRAASRCA